MRQTVRVFPTAADVAKEGAKILITIAREKPNAAIALSGGSTPKAMYEALRGFSHEDANALRAAQYFFGDERSVDNYHRDSNVALAVNEFAKALKIPYRQIEAPDGAAVNLDEEAARLTHRLYERVADNDAGIPAFDLVFLGMGTDGHTASLFPQTAALASSTVGFVANEVHQMNTWRLTLTYPVINSARKVVILCTGENKADVLKKIFSGTGGEYPITKIKGADVEWLLDAAAAAELPTGIGAR
ncbi:MAG: 6-phosphogluconolactonase [Candidatus Sumerlaeota bacterium]